MDVSLIILEWFKEADCVSRAWFCGLEVSPAHLHVGCLFFFARAIVNDRFKNIFPVSAFFLHFASTTLCYESGASQWSLSRNHFYALLISAAL